MDKEELFLNTLNNLYKNNSVYKKKIDDLDINIKDISISDIDKLPLISKSDLLDKDWINVDKSMIKMYHASSGTTGKPLVIGLTENDLKVRSEYIRNICSLSGINKDDVVQICLGFGMFTGGLGFYEGLKDMGCTIIPTATLSTQMQLYYMEKLKPTVLLSSPSQVMHIYEVSKRIGIDIKKFNIRIIKVGSELLTEAMRNKIKKAWGEDVIVSQDYGMTETMGPSIAGECNCEDGMHISNDFYFELIDPITKEKTSKNTGELVITTLKAEGFPLIRYMTNDIVEISYDKCKCGSIVPRIVRVVGRSDDMIKIKGVKVFVSQVEDFLMEYEFLNHQYEIILTNDEFKDHIKINVEYHMSISDIDKDNLLEIEKEMKKNFKSKFGIFADVEIIDNNTIEIKPGKVKRVKDYRIK